MGIQSAIIIVLIVVLLVTVPNATDSNYENIKKLFGDGILCQDYYIWKPSDLIKIILCKKSSSLPIQIMVKYKLFGDTKGIVATKDAIRKKLSLICNELSCYDFVTESLNIKLRKLI